MRRSARHLAGALAVLVAVTACGDAGQEPGTGPYGGGGTPSPDEGISRDEAEDLGVLTGDYDALLEGPTDVRQEGECTTVTLQLRNVGQEGDRYEIEADPDTATVDPDHVALEAGAATDVAVHTCGDGEPLVVSAHSEARDEVVAQLRR